MRPPPRSTLFPYTTLFRSTLSSTTEECACSEETDQADESSGKEARLRRVVALRQRAREEHGADGSGRSRDGRLDRKSTRLNSSHGYISYAVFCLKKKNHNT